jgi:hypothetical protein
VASVRHPVGNRLTQERLGILKGGASAGEALPPSPLRATVERTVGRRGHVFEPPYGVDYCREREGGGRKGGERSIENSVARRGR